MRITTKLSEYQDKYRHIKLERDADGILLVTLHNGNGGAIVWGLGPHEEVAACWEDVGRDPENKVIILTGAGETFIGYADDVDTTTVPSADEGEQEDVFAPATWSRLHNVGIRIILSNLDIEVPVIAAVNGDATAATEQALLADIVLCAEMAEWSDGHFQRGLPPGDGAQVVWPLLAGLNRGRHLLLTGERISAARAHEIGLVTEVVPRDRLLERAYELARPIAAKPDLLLRTTRNLLVREVRRAIVDNVGYGIMAEALVATSYKPEAP